MKPTTFRCRSAKTVALYVFHAILAAVGTVGTILCVFLLLRSPTGDPYFVILMGGIWIFPLLLGAIGGVATLIVAIWLILCSAGRKIVMNDTHVRASADPLTAQRVQHALKVAYKDIASFHPITLHTDTKGNALRTSRPIPCLSLCDASGSSVGIISLKDYSPVQHTAIMTELEKRIRTGTQQA